MGHVRKFGLICGLKLEAKIAIKSGFPKQLIRIAGPGALNAVADVAALKAAGADCIISFGLAGGLDPDLPPGTVIIARRINRLTPQCLAGCDVAFCAELASIIPAQISQSSDCIVSSLTPVMSREAKAALRQAFGADSVTAAVDMESGPLQKAANDAELPFATLRVVADPAHRAVPAVLAQAVTSSGGIYYPTIITGLITGKVKFSQILDLQKDSAAANKTLSITAAALAKRR